MANGSEEIETVTLVDVLRRGQCQVTLASIEATPLIQASRQVGLVADCLLSDCADQTFDLILLPGGMPGASRLGDSPLLHQMLTQQLQAQRALGAICAAPAVVLGRKGWLAGKQATCYPAFAQELQTQGANYLAEPVVRDGLMFTSQGPATAMAFAVELLRYLMGDATADDVAAGLLMG